MKTKDYLDEYAGCYRAVDNCSDSIGGVEDCHICKEDKERMQEIEKELETSIRKDVLGDLSKLRSRIYEENFLDVLEMYALSKGITLK